MSDLFGNHIVGFLVIRLIFWLFAIVVSWALTSTMGRLKVKIIIIIIIIIIIMTLFKEEAQLD